MNFARSESFGVEFFLSRDGDTFGLVFKTKLQKLKSELACDPCLVRGGGVNGVGGVVGVDGVVLVLDGVVKVAMGGGIGVV